MRLTSLTTPAALVLVVATASAQTIPTTPANATPAGSAAIDPKTEAPQRAAQSAEGDGGLGELVTDRPDFTESSEVVGHGVLQLETGFTLEGDRSGGVASRSISTPTVLARIGMGSRFELRLAGDGFLRGWTPGTTAVSGYSDFEVGAKVKFLARENFGLAVIPAVSVPMKNTYYSSGTYDTTVKLAWGTTLPRDFGLSGNVNASSLTDELGRYSQQAVSISLGHDLVGGWAGYWEGYGFTRMERGSGSAWTVNTGVTRGIGNNLQLDVEVGRGVTSDAPDWFFGFGFVMRTQILGPRR